MNHSSILLIMLFWLFSFQSYGQDISQSVVQGGQGATSKNGGFLDLGLGIEIVRQPYYGYPEGNREDNLKISKNLNFVVNGRYQHNDFFIEAFSSSLSGLNLGYNLLDNKNWSADLILSPIFGYLGEDISKDWQTLDERELIMGAGVRLSYFKNNNILQFRLLYGVVTDELSHTLNSSLHFGHTWQVRNWNFHLLTGLEFYNKEVVDHFFGVSAAEAELNPELNAYTAGAGFYSIGEFGAAYPIAENWIFRGQYRYSHILGSVDNSPLLVSDHEHAFFATISYVF